MDRKQRILIACPAKGGVNTAFFKAYHEVMKAEWPEHHIEFMIEDGYQVLCLSRNALAQVAIDEKFDRIIQIDNDHPWTIAHLRRILSHDLPIVGGLYCKKKPKAPEWLAIATPGAQVQPSGLLQVDYIGTGGLLSIDVNVFKKMRDEMPEREFVHDYTDGKPMVMTEYFPIGIVGPNTYEGKLARIRGAFNKSQTMASDEVASLLNQIKFILDDKTRGAGRLLGEDYFFCALARKCGYKIFCDTGCIVPHLGQIAFPITGDMVATPSSIGVEGLSLDPWL